LAEGGAGDDPVIADRQLDFVDPRLLRRPPSNADRPLETEIAPDLRGVKRVRITPNVGAGRAEAYLAPEGRPLPAQGSGEFEESGRRVAECLKPQVIDVGFGYDQQLDVLPESAVVRLDDRQEALRFVADLLVQADADGVWLVGLPADQFGDVETEGRPA